MAAFLNYNGTVLAIEQFQLSYQNRAFQYGDGLFETIRYERGQIWFWPDHYDRLQEGLLVLALDASFGADQLRLQIRELIETNELQDRPVRIKLQIWRQPGGLYTPTRFESDYLLTVQETSPFSLTTKKKVGIFDAIRLHPSPLSVFKTLSALPYILAGIYKQKNNLDDVLLLDTNGHLAECLASNLFWIKNKILFTPSLKTGCINGILRRQVLKKASAVGLDVREGFFLPAVLDQADLVFCTNVMGLQWIEWAGKAMPDADAPLMQSARHLVSF